MYRLVKFQFDFNGPIGGIAQPNITATKFEDQRRNRYHNLSALAATGGFILTFNTQANIDETIDSIEAAGKVNSNGGTTANWVLDFTTPDIYWTIQPQNTDGFVYLLTFPFTLKNNANPAVAADIPAGGAKFYIDITIDLA